MNIFTGIQFIDDKKYTCGTLAYMDWIFVGEKFTFYFCFCFYFYFLFKKYKVRLISGTTEPIVCTQMNASWMLNPNLAMKIKISIKKKWKFLHVVFC